MFKYQTRLNNFVPALLLSVVLAGCAAGLSSVPGVDLQQRIEAAQTRTDHDALAAYYDKEALAAHATSVEHRKMAKAYMSSRSSGAMAAHCDAIARSYEGIAADYAGMAADHRRIAGQAKP